MLMSWYPTLLHFPSRIELLSFLQAVCNFYYALRIELGDKIDITEIILGVIDSYWERKKNTLIKIWEM
jgi:hypothetical protein